MTDPASPKPKLSSRKKLLFSFLILAGFLVLLEVVATSLQLGRPWPSVVIFEDSGRSVHFDAVRGHRLTSTPSRWARLTGDRFEFIGTLRGNSEGFADRDDFGPLRTKPGEPRYAVFGDSFTAGQFLEQNWPDRAEELSRERGRPAHFLNFAIDGGGLANWWSVLTRIVDAEGYEIDGLIFAVFFDDLARGFTVMDHRGQRHYAYARMRDWNPESWPSSVDEARARMHGWPGQHTFILSSVEFEQVLQGRVPSALRAPFRLELTSRLLRLLRGEGGSPLRILPYPHPRRMAGRERLIGDIAAFVDEREIPVWVVFIPWRDHLLAGIREESGGRLDTRRFAARIGGRFVDGAAIFDGMGEGEIRSHWLPVDGHWNQRGSDLFAEFVVDAVTSEPQPGHAGSADPVSRRSPSAGGRAP